MKTPNLSRPSSLGMEFDDKSVYERELAARQQHFLNIQQALFQNNERAIVLFEGPDASGKGGVIRRATHWLDPRGYRVHAIGAPTDAEQGRHYLWRFFQHLPPPGRIAIFDRSWYGRVLVERVEGLTQAAAWQRAYREINEFERWLVDDGVRLCKVYLSIDADEQARRFIQRLNDPRKYWKLTEEDLRNRERWDDYVAAANDMFAKTHRRRAPWHLVDARHKWQARVHVLGILNAVLGRGLNVKLRAIDPSFLSAASKALGLPVKDH